jgi:hypothetical protein
MKKINVYVDYLSIKYNGKPEEVNPRFLERDNGYVIQVSLYSPGCNRNKSVEGAVSFTDMDRDVDFTPFALEEKHLLSAQVGKRVEINASLFYLEPEPFVLAFLRQTTGKFASLLLGYLAKLDVSKIAAMPAQILPTAYGILKEGIEKKESWYEIGRGKLGVIEEGANTIPLASLGVKRPIQYWDANNRRQRREVRIVPSGPNGFLRLVIEEA